MIRLAIELDPADAHRWFCLGLICKWRGWWVEGVEANQKARELGKTNEAVLWNLGVCATGARDTFTASEAWLALGIKTRPGADGLPEMEEDALVQIRVSTLGEGITPAAHRAGADADYTFEYLVIEAHSEEAFLLCRECAERGDDPATHHHAHGERRGAS